MGSRRRSEGRPGHSRSPGDPRSPSRGRPLRHTQVAAGEATAPFASVPRCGGSDRSLRGASVPRTAGRGAECAPFVDDGAKPHRDITRNRTAAGARSSHQASNFSLGSPKPLHQLTGAISCPSAHSHPRHLRFRPWTCRSVTSTAAVLTPVSSAQSVSRLTGSIGLARLRSSGTPAMASTAGPMHQRRIPTRLRPRHHLRPTSRNRSE